MPKHYTAIEAEELVELRNEVAWLRERLANLSGDRPSGAVSAVLRDMSFFGCGRVVWFRMFFAFFGRSVLIPKVIVVPFTLWTLIIFTPLFLVWTSKHL